MATTLSLPGTLTFRVWDFSTATGGGFAVVRTDWCEVARRTTIERQAAHLGEGWRGERFTVRRYSVQHAEDWFRARWTVSADVRRCTCGCLNGTDREPKGLWDE